MLNEDQLKELTDLAQALMPVDDIATILAVDASDLKAQIAQDNTPAAVAYRTGQLRNKAEFHKVQISLAKSGSQAAATLVEKLRAEQKMSEV